MRLVLTCCVLLLIVLTAGCSSNDSASNSSSSSSSSTSSSATPSPKSPEVVQAFKDAGLEVGDTNDIDTDARWKEFIGPKTYQEGTRFAIPSTGRDSTGQVFTYKTKDDLNVMKNYWNTLNENTTGFLYSHVYDKGLILVHIGGGVPKGQADKYGDVLNSKF